MLTKIATPNAPAAIGPYSQAIIVNSVIYTSGQIPLHPETGEIIGEDIITQTEQVMKNISAVLAASNSSCENIIKTTCFLANMEDFVSFNQVYSSYITENPARSCVAVRTLPKNVLVEVEVIALQQIF